ncbi:fumarylacetoacetate hydrolase family protein [Aestuariivirga sp. YIM B02566]|uniref:Fumarylacetoacetate hydrolase family protein n=1 Tax=Taklimakanibacter albus TaxID=2800327 RepID=A0ACC5RBN5_9HYPH|nr:fumarylacetoacetate hydrolase family protein [Aestuariivirga sp. YIM B02566]MBK1870033.1 fumarylacetoacetate hydrolase family protein [Aestuariivirga sp. YIM B02566]
MERRSVTAHAFPHPNDGEFVVPVPPVTAVPVANTSSRFPVRRVYCVGRNYAAHAVEMGHDPSREPPFFFQKNPDNILLSGSDFPYPTKSNDVHFEAELVIAIGRGGSEIAESDALGHIFGYAVGLDMTRRDLQGEAKDLRRPWEVGKAFESSAPCSDIVPAAQIGHPTSGEIWLTVDGERRQTGDLNQMIWKTPEIISYLSGLFTLAPGDLIYSGTPSGVGAVTRGQVMHAVVSGVGELKMGVV